MTLFEPDYIPTPGSIGGGAAGVAPFRLHDSGCAPSNYETIILYFTDPTHVGICEALTPEDLTLGYVDLRFYGRIVDFTDSLTHPALVVRSRRHGSTAGWSVEAGYQSEVVEGQENVVRVTRASGGGFRSGRQYEITLSADPQSPRVRCDDVAGEPDIAEFTYRVSVRYGGCEEELLALYDLNNDGAIDELDIGDWIMMPADFNEDAAANSTDLGLLLGGKQQFDLIQEELTAE